MWRKEGYPVPLMQQQLPQLWGSRESIDKWLSGLKMCDVCVCVWGQCENISCDISSAVGNPCDQSASIVILPTQTSAWTNANLAGPSTKPVVCSCLSFSSSFPIFHSTPRLTPFFLFSPFPSVTPSSFLTSSHPALLLISCSTYFPDQSGSVLYISIYIYLPAEIQRSKLLTGFFVDNRVKLEGKSVRYESKAEVDFWSLNPIVFQTLLRIHQQAHPSGPPISKGLHPLRITHTNTHTETVLSLSIWASCTLPLSSTCSPFHQPWNSGQVCRERWAAYAGAVNWRHVW